jgi:hypothetical protein
LIHENDGYTVHDVDVVFAENDNGTAGNSARVLALGARCLKLE